MLSLTEIPSFRKYCWKSVLSETLNLLGKAHSLNYLLFIHCILRFYAVKENVFVQRSFEFKKHHLTCHENTVWWLELCVSPVIESAV